MSRVIVILLFFVISSWANSALVCENELTIDRADTLVGDFIKKNNISLPDKYEKNLTQSKTCQYIYSITPAEDSPSIWLQHGHSQAIINTKGLVVDYRRYDNPKFECPAMDKEKEYFTKLLTTLRQKIPELPAEPKQFNISFSVIPCNYIYVEYIGKENLRYVPQKNIVNTFYFDYTGELIDYYRVKNYKD